MPVLGLSRGPRSCSRALAGTHVWQLGRAARAQARLCAGTSKGPAGILARRLCPEAPRRSVELS
eukprot:4842557-Alexandrium_andersonii.AAC.1